MLFDGFTFLFVLQVAFHFDGNHVCLCIIIREKRNGMKHVNLATLCTIWLLASTETCLLCEVMEYNSLIGCYTKYIRHQYLTVQPHHLANKLL